HPLPPPQLALGRVVFAARADRHLADPRRRRVGDHMAARVELRAWDRLEAVVGDPELGRVEGEHRGIAADRAGEQKFERARCPPTCAGSLLTNLNPLSLHSSSSLSSPIDVTLTSTKLWGPSGAGFSGSAR